MQVEEESVTYTEREWKKRLYRKSKKYDREGQNRVREVEIEWDRMRDREGDRVRDREGDREREKERETEIYRGKMIIKTDILVWIANDRHYFWFFK